MLAICLCRSFCCACFTLSSAVSFASFFLNSFSRSCFCFLSISIVANSFFCESRRLSFSVTDFFLRAIFFFISLALLDISAAFLSWYSEYRLRYSILLRASPRFLEERIKVTLFCTPLVL